MNEATNLIAVSHDIIGNPYYSGYNTVHEALWNLKPEFRVLDFVARTMVANDILNDLEGSSSHTFLAKEFVYMIYQIEDDIWFGVYDMNHPEDPIYKGIINHLMDQGIVKDPYDIKGLHAYLVKGGELLPEDTLTLYD